MTTKRTLTLLLVLAMLLAMLAGCAKEEQAAEEAPAVEESAPVEETPPAEEAPPAEEEAPVEEAPAEPGEVDMSVYPVFEETRIITGMMTGRSETNILMNGDPTSSIAFKTVEEVCNVEFEFYASTEYSTQFSLMMAGGEYYDLLESPQNYVTGGIDAVVEDDVCFDLTEWIPEYAPAYNSYLNLDASFRKQLTSDEGHLVTVTGYSPVSNDGFVVRADWLDKLGLEKPMTYDQMHDVLVAFKTEFNPSAPFFIDAAFIWNNSCFTSGYGFVTDAMGFDLPWCVREGGEVFCPYQTDEYYDFLVMMKGWYDEGLIDHDFFTNGMIWEREKHVLSSNTGILVGVADMLTNAYKSQAADPDFRMEATYDIRMTEDQILNHGGTVTSVANQMGLGISTQCEDPELVLRVLDYTFTQEGQFKLTWGNEGETFEYDADGKPCYTELITDNPDGLSQEQALTVYFNLFPGSVNSKEKALRTADNEEMLECYDIWCYNKTEELVYYGTLTTEENDIYGQKSGDMLTYSNESIIKMVTGTEPLSYYYDTFQPTMMSMGLEELVALKQAAYDRYMAR